MYFSDREKRVMEGLFRAISENSNQTHVLEYANGDIIEVQADTCYETDNGLDVIDPDYEEYHACAMRIIKVRKDQNRHFQEGSLIEINYRNYPGQIRDEKGNRL